MTVALHTADPGAVDYLSQHEPRRLSTRQKVAIAGCAGVAGFGLLYLGLSEADKRGIPVKFSFIPSLKERRLEPETLRRYLMLKSRLAARGIQLFTGSTRRTQEEEEGHKAAGRSATSMSWHMSGRALDAYPINPATGKADFKAVRADLFRVMHQEWHRLGGHGLAYLPYPDGPNRIIRGPHGSFWDAGHLEFRGGYATAAQAYAAAQRSPWWAA